jgi:hypothetical protein
VQLHSVLGYRPTACEATTFWPLALAPRLALELARARHACCVRPISRGRPPPFERDGGTRPPHVPGRGLAPPPARGLSRRPQPSPGAPSLTGGSAKSDADA